MKHSPASQGDTPGNLYDLVNNHDTHRTYGAIKSRFIRHITPILTQTQHHPSLLPSAKLFVHSLGEFLWLKEQQASSSDLAINCVANMYFHLARWQPNPGRVGRELPSLVKALLEILKQPGNGSDDAWLKLSNQINSYAKALGKRSDALESRQRDSIKNQEQFEHARRYIGAKINQALTGASLTNWLQVFIQKHLYADLTTAYYVDPESVCVNHWVNVLNKLHTLFQNADDPNPSNETRQVIYAEGPILIDHLNESLYQEFTDISIYPAVLERLTDLIVCRVKLERIDLVPYRLLKDTKSHPTSAEAVSGNIQSPDLAPSKWFHLMGSENTVLSGKIFHINQQSKSIYFADYYGKRSLVLSFDQFEAMLSEKKLTPIRDFMDSYRSQVRIFTEQELTIHAQQANNAKDTKDHPPPNTIQILPTVDQLNRERADVAGQPDPISKRKSESELTAFGNAVDKMQLGARIRLKNDNSNVHKLTLKLPTADKFVFTDRLREKSAEFTRAELILLFQTDELEIISSGQRFDSKLEEIVKNQR